MSKGNPRRAFRYDDDENWQRFRDLAHPTASDVLRQFVDYFTRKPGAKMPRRPSADDSTVGDG